MTIKGIAFLSLGGKLKDNPDMSTLLESVRIFYCPFVVIYDIL